MTEHPDEFHQCKYAFNEHVQAQPDWSGADYTFLSDNDMWDFHRSLPGYAPTPLIPEPGIARRLGVAAIHTKDESQRFGLNAFKALGASYAVYRFLKKQYHDRFGETLDPAGFQNPAIIKRLGRFTFCAATDGNHGRAVAWTARMLGQEAVIYMPDNTAPSRIDNILAEGARVRLAAGTFDDCVRQCAEDAEKYGMQAISDTAYPGYTDIPRYIMLGYTSIFREMEQTINGPAQPGIDFVFLPAGVGGLAAAGASYYVRRYGAGRPTLICVEPSDCDCFLESVRFGKGAPLPTRGAAGSIMAGLNCGVPSPVAWPIIRDSVRLFTAITDDYAEEAMREHFRENIISGESGAAGLAALIALFRDPRLQTARTQLQLNRASRILLLNTEGDTDPVRWREITGRQAT